MNEEFSMNVFEDRTICLKNFQIWNLFPIFFLLERQIDRTSYSSNGNHA